VNAVYFYVASDVPYGVLSNFSPHGFELDGLYWPTVEHYFQAQKFSGTDYMEKIRTARGPKAAGELGQTRKLKLREDWEDVKESVMLKALRRKFETHADLRDLLLSTGDAPIIENAPSDYYWGCGKDGSGKNRLGVLLMQVRQELAEASA
jgi:ribA/ribD-fused uncharacterized protein